MKKSKSAIIFGSGLVASLMVGQVSFAKEYSIDASHSTVGFVVRHLVSKVAGDFKKFEGSMSFDPENPTQAKVVAKVKADSVDTNEKKRDEHLRGEDFFAVKKFPELTFVSKSVKPSGEKNKFKVEGDLTMHGVTKPVTFDAEYLGEADDPWGNHRIGLTAMTVINRKDFGINWNKSLDKGGFVLGDEVTIDLKLEGLEQKTKEEAKKADEKLEHKKDLKKGK